MTVFTGISWGSLHPVVAAYQVSLQTWHLESIWYCGQWSLTGDPAVTVSPGPGLQQFLRHQTEVPPFNYFIFLFLLAFCAFELHAGVSLIEFLPEDRHCLAYSGHLTLPSSVMSLQCHSNILYRSASQSAAIVSTLQHGAPLNHMSKQILS